MHDGDFQTKLREYVETIATLPEEQRKRLMDLVTETRERQEMIVRMQREALDTLDDWRITEKYRLFDLECRERESQPQNEFGEEFDSEF